MVWTLRPQRVTRHRQSPRKYPSRGTAWWTPPHRQSQDITTTKGDETTSVASQVSFPRDGLVDPASPPESGHYDHKGCRDNVSRLASILPAGRPGGPRLTARVRTLRPQRVTRQRQSPRKYPSRGTAWWTPPHRQSQDITTTKGAETTSVASQVSFPRDGLVDPASPPESGHYDHKG